MVHHQCHRDLSGRENDRRSGHQFEQGCLCGLDRYDPVSLPVGHRVTKLDRFVPPMCPRTTPVLGLFVSPIYSLPMQRRPSRVLSVEPLETRTLLDATLLIGTWNVDIADTGGKNRDAAAFQEVFRAVGQLDVLTVT